MKTFQRKTAGRIAAVTLLMAACASPLAWFVSRENAEQEVVAFAQEESRRVIAVQGSLQLNGPEALVQAEKAAQLLTGGLFEIAEIYDAQGHKLAESVTEEGEVLEKQLPGHGAPKYAKPFYENLTLPDGQWALRVFVPLRVTATGPIHGYFEGAGWLDGAREVVGGHHEKWDGSGYPRGLSGEGIPLSARIFAVADVFDALSSRRPYKGPMPFEQVLGILQEGRGSHFDPTVLDTFTDMAPALHQALQGLDEVATRKLMTGMVYRHFEILV